jgi:hypothetical protein
VFVSAAFGLFTRIGGPLSAGLSICLGTIVWGVGYFVFEWPAPYLVAIACSTAAYLAASFWKPDTESA